MDNPECIPFSLCPRIFNGLSVKAIAPEFCDGRFQILTFVTMLQEPALQQEGETA